MDRAKTALGGLSAKTLGGAAAGRTSAAQVLGKVTETAAAAATQGAAAAKEAGQTVSAAAKGKRDEFKQEAKKWLLEVIYDYVEKLIARGPRVIKNFMDDPDMPDRAKRIQDAIIDKAWPDIREEIMWEVAVHLDAVKQREEDDKGPAPWYVPRGFLRYHIYPYDKALWGKLRDPFWIMFTLGSLIPVSGFYALVYAVLFLIIDKSDEFQLLQFILQFKGTQFLSHGVIRTIMGFFMFVNCVSAPAKEEQHTCEERGPGTYEFYRGMYELAIFGWILQVVMMWAAYLCLRCSVEKGRRELKGRFGSTENPGENQIVVFGEQDGTGVRLGDKTIQAPTTSSGSLSSGGNENKLRKGEKTFVHTGAKADGGTGPGGYIRYFLFYDAVCFVVVVCALFIVIAVRPEGIDEGYKHWSIRHAFFSAQVVYGYLSMPFFIFMIPVLERFLTHSVYTAYDKEGRCVAYVGPPKRKKDEDEGDEELSRWGSMFKSGKLSQASTERALNAKLEVLYDKVKDIMTNIPKVPSDRLGRRSADGVNADV